MESIDEIALHQETALASTRAVAQFLGSRFIAIHNNTIDMY